MLEKYRIAVLIPCYNEAITIKDVIVSFKQALPTSTIYVYDNSSTDNTATIAQQAGAIVCFESQKGKGNVVKRMFADIDADIYVLVDGDNTYEASKASYMVKKLINNNLDMVVGRRVEKEEMFSGVYRRGHRFGNKIFNIFLRKLFGGAFVDVFSGYRAFSRRFVKSFPVSSQRFEIETELNVHCLELNLPASEIDTRYFARSVGSLSKLSTYKDGMRIFFKILFFLKEFRPFLFFNIIAFLLFMLAVILGIPLLITYLQTGLVPRIPTGMLIIGLLVSAFTSCVCGVILDSVSRGRREMKYLQYLLLPHYPRFGS
jgi:glycosyltransferase involved in cell wall biosynthesis